MSGGFEVPLDNFGGNAWPHQIDQQSWNEHFPPSRALYLGGVHDTVTKPSVVLCIPRSDFIQFSVRLTHEIVEKVHQNKSTSDKRFRYLQSCCPIRATGDGQSGTRDINQHPSVRPSVFFTQAYIQVGTFSCVNSN